MFRSLLGNPNSIDDKLIDIPPAPAGSAAQSDASDLDDIADNEMNFMVPSTLVTPALSRQASNNLTSLSPENIKLLPTMPSREHIERMLERQPVQIHLPELPEQQQEPELQSEYGRSLSTPRVNFVIPFGLINQIANDDTIQLTSPLNSIPGSPREGPAPMDNLPFVPSRENRRQLPVVPERPVHVYNAQDAARVYLYGDPMAAETDDEVEEYDDDNVSTVSSDNTDEDEWRSESSFGLVKGDPESSFPEEDDGTDSNGQSSLCRVFQVNKMTSSITQSTGFVMEFDMTVTAE